MFIFKTFNFAGIYFLNAESSSVLQRDLETQQACHWFLQYSYYRKRTSYSTSGSCKNKEDNSFFIQFVLQTLFKLENRNGFEKDCRSRSCLTCWRRINILLCPKSTTRRTYTRLETCSLKKEPIGIFYGNYRPMAYFHIDLNVETIFKSHY